MVNSCDTRMPTTRAIAGIVDAGADHGAEPRAVEQQPERRGDHRGDDDDREPVGRERQPATRASRRAAPAGVSTEIGSPPHMHQADIGDHEGQAERDQHLRQLGARPGGAARSRSMSAAEQRDAEPGASSAASQKSDAPGDAG